ncbi:hypothetical protein Tco_1074576 [Tanacetum coccineum]
MRKNYCAQGFEADEGLSSKDSYKQIERTDSTEVRSSKRGAEVGLEGSKKQKTNEASESVQEQPNKEEKELP